MNRRITVLQTAALPLGYAAGKSITSTSQSVFSLLLFTLGDWLLMPDG